MITTEPRAVLFEKILDTADYFERIGVDYSHIIKRRDPKEPGRRRKEMMEDELYRWARGYWRAQSKHIKERITFKYPTRKAIEAPPELEWIMADFNGDKWLARLKKLLIKASQDGVLLFEELTPLGIDYTLTNVEAAKWAAGYSFDLVKGIDSTTVAALQNAISTFVEINYTMKLYVCQGYFHFFRTFQQLLKMVYWVK